jgi:hypothetical protein
MAQTIKMGSSHRLQIPEICSLGHGRLALSRTSRVPSCRRKAIRLRAVAAGPLKLIAQSLWSTFLSRVFVPNCGVLTRLWCAWFFFRSVDFFCYPFELSRCPYQAMTVAALMRSAHTTSITAAALKSRRETRSVCETGGIQTGCNCLP